MKKLVLLVYCGLMISPAYASLPVDASIIQVHDMQLLNQQKFRMEEINDYNDVQTEKERYQKKNAPSEPLVNKLFNKKKFVEQDGKIKIESDN